MTNKAGSAAPARPLPILRYHTFRRPDKGQGAARRDVPLPVIRQSKQPAASWDTPRAVRKWLAGGGGGSRTPVREYSTRSVYRHRSGMILVLPVAPDRARQNQPAGALLAITPGRAPGIASLMMCRQPGLSGINPSDVTVCAVSCPAD